MKRDAVKVTAARTSSRKNRDVIRLEREYREYLVPMSLEKWLSTSDLSQPSLLKKVPSRTVYSSAE